MKSYIVAILIFEIVDNEKCDHSYTLSSSIFPPKQCMFIMLYKVALTFEPVDEILMSDYSNESY